MTILQFYGVCKMSAKILGKNILTSSSYISLIIEKKLNKLHQKYNIRDFRHFSVIFD